MIPATSRPAWAEIDADALVNNVRVIKQLIGRSELCAVVKADGYGHGASLVAPVLQAEGVSSFAVATIDEAVELRNSGIVGSILCLSEPEVSVIEDAIRSQVTLTLYSERGIRETRRALDRLWRNGYDIGTTIGYHLKVDTGMHRVGANPQDVLPLALMGRDSGLVLEGFWTHMSVADNPGSTQDNEFSVKQLETFASVTQALVKEGFAPRLHVANSAAAANYPESRFDMVRSGIAIYGYSPSPFTNIAGLRTALTLKAKVSFVRCVSKGERPSYGRLRATMADNTVLATVPLGYADGLPRKLFDYGAEVLIRGQRRQLAGVITMDQVIVDCGDDSSISVGDEVVFLGSQGSQTISPDEWANLLGTINYEIITGIGSRVPRVLVNSESKV